MASDSQAPPFLSWQFLVLIAAGLGIIMAQPGTLPLSPAGNTQDNKDKAPDNVPTLTDSRLWSDPYGELPKPAQPTAGPTPLELAAVKTADVPSLSLTLAKPGISGEARERIAKGQICILPVVVRGDALSPEAREMRIRFRIATASGLGADGFVPDDPTHLMWVNLAAAGARPMIAPVEWFLRGSLSRTRYSPYEAVLVVWIRDDMLFTNPMQDLQGFKTRLATQLRTLSLAGKTPAFKVIGPYWSGTLVDILNETQDDGKNLIFYSSSATMANGALELLASKKDPGGAMGRLRLQNADAGPVLVNLTCNDEELSESLINELELRGVDPGNDNSRIAIISDWDTDYGRLLPLTFAAKFKQWLNRRMTDPVSAARGIPMESLHEADYSALKYDDASTWPTQILRAYYLSGVEGNLSADRVPKPSEDSKTVAPGSSSTAISLQRAEGEHQIDYVARLGRIFSRRIRERDVKPGERGKLVAIGVLGADVYDKLLLIQALRPLFKDAVFFTDTLDARFMDPTKAIPYTRNLVIATSYGFDLFRALQLGAPPFRSTEQTGAFLAVQAAVARDKPELDNIHDQVKPLRFEIGRNYPVSLDIPYLPRRVDYKEDLVGPVDKFDGLLHPPQDAFFPGWRRFIATYLWPTFCAVICAALLFVTVFVVLKGALPSFQWRSARSRTVALSTIASVAFVGLIFKCYDGVEPATWIEGVSIWPSEIIRLAALATGIYGLLYCQCKVRDARADLAKQFGIKPPPDGPPMKTGFWKRFWGTLTRKPQPEAEFICTYSKARSEFKWLGSSQSVAAAVPFVAETGAGQVPDPSKPYVILEALWSHFCRQSTLFRRTSRTVAMTSAFFVAWILLGFVIGFPVIPFRGPFSHGCDVLIVLSASLLLTYLMFWVVDETHICLRFVEKLGRREPTLWPLKAFDRIPKLRPVLGTDRIRDNAASSYLDVCFIGQLTGEAVPLIILPFVVLTLMIIARWNFFANWRWDPLVLMIFGFDAAICVCCAVKLRNAAVDAKERAVGQMAVAAAMARADGRTPRAEALEALKALMEKNMEGAYKPWHQQPFVSAMLLPFGGSGGLGLIEYFLSR